MTDDQIAYLLAHARRCRALATKAPDVDTRDALIGIALEHVDRVRALTELQRVGPINPIGSTPTGDGSHKPASFGG